MTPAAAQLWADLRRELQRSIDAATTPSYFETIRSCSPGVRPFASVGALLGYLGEDLSADLDAKSAIFADLILCSQRRGGGSSLAQTLLWLGLWPGLSAAVGRQAWFWRDAPADLISEVTNIFTELVTRMDLSRVRRVFGTLVRSTERDVIRTSVIRQRDLHRETPANLPVAVPGTIHEEPISPRKEENLAALAKLIAFARKGEVHDPVVQALALGLGEKHVVATLGIKGPAARKRLQRARDKLRATLATTSPLSRPAAFKIARGQIKGDRRWAQREAVRSPSSF
jgi:hypothetical protein